MSSLCDSQFAQLILRYLNSRNGRVSPPPVDMSTCIRYKISNRLKVDNAAFCKPSDINPITGNPIYRDSFTHTLIL